MLGKIMFVVSRYGGIFPGMRDSLKRMDVDFTEVPIWNMEEGYEKLKPQTIIFFHHFLKEWDTSIIDRIDKLSCHKLYWDFEMPWEVDFIRQYHHHFTHVILQDKNTTDILNAEVQQGKFIFCPHAADKDLATTIDVPFAYRSDLCFIGAAYPSRLKFFREVLPQLKDYKVVIGGTGWEFLPDTNGQKIINTGLGAEEYIKYYKGTKVALNLHRLSDEMPIANTGMIKASSPNNRFFELNMMGCFQMVDNIRFPEIDNYYLSDYSLFKDTKHFLTSFEVYIADVNERKRIAKEIQKETFEKHSYENRFSEILAKII